MRLFSLSWATRSLARVPERHASALLPLSLVHSSTFPLLDGHDRSGVGPRHARQQHAHQPDEKFLVAGGPGDHVGQPAEHLDAVIGIAELHLLEVLRAERLLLDRLRGIGGDVHPLVGQGEGGLADDKVLAGREREPVDFLAAEEDGISGIGKPGDLQAPAVPEQAGVAARNVVIPGHGPGPAQPAQKTSCLPAASAATAVGLQFLGQSGRASQYTPVSTVPCRFLTIHS